MSQFREKLKYLIDGSGMSVNQIAKNACMDRTTLQRSLSGERTPSEAFLEKLCDYLRVSTADRRDLMQLYSIYKMGDMVYAGRKYVKELIEQFATLHTNNNDAYHFEKKVHVSEEMKEEMKVFSGQYSVNKLLRDLLEEEAFTEDMPHICLTVPFTYTYLFDSLQQLYYESRGKISIKHIVSLSKDPHNKQNPNINLEMLSNILPLAFCIGNGYQPHYYYATGDIGKDIPAAMPYYLYTSKRLVVLSEDFKTAILYNSVSIRNVYCTAFQKSLSQTSPFLRQLTDCDDMLSTYLQVLQDCGQVTNVIEPQPCFAKYYTHKMVDDHLRPDVPNREAVRQGLYQYYDNLLTFASDIKTFFSAEGLAFLTATGILADLPPRFALPFTVEERKYLIRSLRNDIENNDFVARITDSSKFLISSLATIQIYKNSGLVFMAAGDNGIVSCFIDEQSICNAFCDFVESLPKSDLIYSKEETLKVLDEFLEQLKDMKN